MHSHLDLYPNAMRLVKEVSRRNHFTLVVTTSPRAWLATSRAFAGYSNIKIGLGLHPEIVEKKVSERELLISLVEKAEFIGEIGLDGSSRFRPSLDLQSSILSDVLSECERLGGRIMSLHSRGAASRVLKLLKSHPRAGYPILHWFSGTANELTRAVDMGCWFSVGPAMLANERGREMLATVPRNRLLPETDGPFATEGGRPLMPWEVGKVVDELAAVWNVSAGEVTDQIKQNLSDLLSMAGLRNIRDQSNRTLGLVDHDAHFAGS